MQSSKLEKSGVVAAGLLWMAGTLFAAGCESQPDSGDGMAGSGSRAASSGASGQTPAEIVAAKRSPLDEQYVIGPTAADRLGYRVMWDISPRLNDVVELARLDGDSLFLVDADNSVTRLMRSNGAQTWLRPIGTLTDSVLGVNRASFNGVDVILALTQGDVHVFETGNGVQRDRQPLDRTANTAAILFGPALIYGSLNGQLVWHHYELSSYMGGTTLHGAVSAPPALLGDVVVGVSDQGHVLAVEAGNHMRMWSKMARSQIVAAPALNQEAVYVASLDQHLRCYNINNGQVMWDHLHSGPLTQPPVLIADKLLLQTPDMGLVCYEALPYADLDGNILWNNEEAKGTVIGRHRGRLFAWDARSHTFEVLDEGSGGVIDRVQLPKAEKVLVSEFDSGEIYVIAENGQTTKIVPRQ